MFILVYDFDRSGRRYAFKGVSLESLNKQLYDAAVNFKEIAEDDDRFTLLDCSGDQPKIIEADLRFVPALEV